MNPLVEKMLIAQREGIDVSTLEQIFEHEAKCESNHNYTPYCSGDICYRIITCQTDTKNCHSTVDDPTTGTKARMSKPGMRCARCNNLASECWTIRPI